MKNPITICAIVFTFLTICSCQKKEAAKPVEKQYTNSTDIQSSKDIVEATQALIDLETMMGFVSSNQAFSSPFMPLQMQGQQTVTIIRNLPDGIFSISFNKTNCLDGKQRSGTVTMKCSFNNKGSSEFRMTTNVADVDFTATFDLLEYSVGDWRIELFDRSRLAGLGNTLPVGDFDEKKTNLAWSFNGKFLLTRISDPTKKIFWEGTFSKTLLNTGDSSVFSKKTGDINWNKALVKYTTMFTRGTINSDIFKYEIKESTALTRDFSCVYASTPSAPSGYVPFRSGIATLEINNYHPREINYGPSDECDRTGSLTFNGETTVLNFD